MTDDVWFYQVPYGEGKKGPFPATEIERLILSGRLGGEALVSRTGKADWTPITSSSFRSLLPLAHQRATEQTIPHLETVRDAGPPAETSASQSVAGPDKPQATSRLKFAGFLALALMAVMLLRSGNLQIPDLSSMFSATPNCDDEQVTTLLTQLLDGQKQEALASMGFLMARSLDMETKVKSTMQSRAYDAGIKKRYCTSVVLVKLTFPKDMPERDKKNLKGFMALGGGTKLFDGVELPQDYTVQLTDSGDEIYVTLVE